MDRDSPNSINHLIVGDFGNEEILLAASDGGGVFSWTVRSIELILGKELAGTDILRPWFQFDVGASVWGLAIHKAARMIAVSSNSCMITVFIPGLSEDPTIQYHEEDMAEGSEEDSAEDSGEETKEDIEKERTSRFRCDHNDLKDRWDIKDCHHPNMRSNSVIINLIGHSHNIPSIAFFNTDREMTKVYLVSTDIAGLTHIWEVRSRKLLLRTLMDKPGSNGKFGAFSTRPL